MLSPDFCEQLEYALSKALRQTDDPQLKGYWCDGVLPGHDLLTGTVFTGRNGQTPYKLIIVPGPLSLKKIETELDFTGCLPLQNKDWITIDTEKKVIKIEVL